MVDYSDPMEVWKMEVEDKINEMEAEIKNLREEITTLRKEVRYEQFYTEYTPGIHQDE